MSAKAETWRFSGSLLCAGSRRDLAQLPKSKLGILSALTWTFLRRKSEGNPLRIDPVKFFAVRVMPAK